MSAEGTGVPAAGSKAPEDLYRRLVESVSVVTFALPFGHADEPFLYVSPQSESLLGLTHEEMMVGPAERVRRIHPEDRDRVASIIINRDGMALSFSRGLAHAALNDLPS